MKKSTISREAMKNVFTMYLNVKYLREKNNLSTSQLAEIIQIDERKLIESEKCINTGYFYDTHIKRVCEYFNVNANDLFTRALRN